MDTSVLLKSTIVFFGTPSFALPSLEALSAAGMPVTAVVTQPDSPAGRGRVRRISPVKQWATARGIPVFQPPGLRRPEDRVFLENLAPDLFVVVAYGKILPKEVLALPRYGALNVHASLLPRYRGPSPIPAAILAGDAETGVTIMLLDEEMDTGPILAKTRVTIGPDDTTVSLTRTLADMGACLLVPTLRQWVAGDIAPQPQDTSQASVCALLSKEDGRIAWSHPAEVIERMVRAYAPWPTAWTLWHPARAARPSLLTIHRATVWQPRSPAKRPGVPGLVWQTEDRQVLVCAGKLTTLALAEVQLQDHQRMDIQAFVRGHQEFLGTKLLSSMPKESPPKPTE